MWHGSTSIEGGSATDLITWRLGQETFSGLEGNIVGRIPSSWSLKWTIHTLVSLFTVRFFRTLCKRLNHIFLVALSAGILCKVTRVPSVSSSFDRLWQHGTQQYREGPCWSMCFTLFTTADRFPLLEVPFPWFPIQADSRFFDQLSTSDSLVWKSRD